MHVAAAHRKGTRIPGWIATLAVTAVCGIAVITYHKVDALELKDAGREEKTKATDARQDTFEKRLDHFERLLERIGDAVGAKKP